MFLMLRNRKQSSKASSDLTQNETHISYVCTDIQTEWIVEATFSDLHIQKKVGALIDKRKNLVHSRDRAHTVLKKGGVIGNIGKCNEEYTNNCAWA